MKKKLFLVYSLIQLWLLILIPIILILMPSNFFDKNKNNCISYLFFNTDCFACGILSALMHLIHLEFKDAAFFNLLSFFILPIILLLWFYIVYFYIKAVIVEKTLIVNFIKNQSKIKENIKLKLFKKK